MFDPSCGEKLDPILDGGGNGNENISDFTTDQGDWTHQYEELLTGTARTDEIRMPFIIVNCRC